MTIWSILLVKIYIKGWAFDCPRRDDYLYPYLGPLEFVSNKNRVPTYPLILEIGRKNFNFKFASWICDSRMELPPPIDTRSKGMWNFTDSLAYLCSNKLNGEREELKLEGKVLVHLFTVCNFLYIALELEMRSLLVLSVVWVALQPAFLVAKLASSGRR